ncbi:MFS transporter [Microbacterium sp. SYP-A9085]|uniref:MFS transporter n=1 Tax=Microbacterium sp. SYP-A9085 TaxID=2664454 RepID=UPI00129A3252|nr:MFS transporter [Microbacterium sp. SYP-A9085]MRH29878.1 MFS transporter [Microbacterium sp. SYP-A9085]
MAVEKPSTTISATGPDTVTAGRSVVLVLLAVFLVGANMRISVYSVGPLIELVATQESVAVASLGGLVSVPLFAWGLVSAFAHALSARFGTYRTVLVSLVTLGLGTLCRSWPGEVANIWIGTFIIGASLAIGNVLIPPLIRRDFGSRTPLMIGMYTGLMASVGAIGAGVMVPLAQLEVGGAPLGWRFALLMTGAPLLPALLCWVIAYRARGSSPAARTGRLSRPSSAAASIRETGVGSRTGSVWRSTLAWLVGIYMGSQSASFYILSTWIPLISVSHGRPLVVAGFDVMIFQLSSILGSFAVPLVYRGRLERWLPAVLPVFMLGMTLLLVFAADLIPLATLFGGLLAGLSLSVALTLPLIRTRDYLTSTALSGMAQSIGYSVAAVGPITFGLLHHLAGDWLLPVGLLALVAALQFGSGLVVGDDRRYVSGRPD